MSPENSTTSSDGPTRTLQSVADELDLPIAWVVEEGATLAQCGWDDRFVEDWDGVKPPPGDRDWSGGYYWNIGPEPDWPSVEVSVEMADRLVTDCLAGVPGMTPQTPGPNVKTRVVAWALGGGWGFDDPPRFHAALSGFQDDYAQVTEARVGQFVQRFVHQDTSRQTDRDILRGCR